MRKTLVAVGAIAVVTLVGNSIGKEMFGPILWPAMLFLGALASGGIGFASMFRNPGKATYDTHRGEQRKSSIMPAGSMGSTSPKPYKIAVGPNLRPDNRIYGLFGGLFYGLFLLVLGLLQTPH